MAKRLAGTTLMYDATEGIYRRTEIYEGEDPSDTVELRIVDDIDVPFESYEIDEGSGPWKRIIQPKDDEFDGEDGQEEKATMRRGPFMLEERHIKRDDDPDINPDKTLDGLPFVRDD
jgi:hypothetical protein